jgi:Spy/CpxP family protein refolding chaperone
MKTLIRSIVVALGLSVVAGQVVAQPSFGPPGGMGTSHAGEGFGQLEFVADRLGLTDDQESQINEIIDAAELVTAVDRERMKQIREALHAMREEFDAGEAQVLANEFGEITARLAYSGAETRAAIHAVFTPEQLQQLEEMKAQRSDMSGHRPGRPQGSPDEDF